MKNRLAKPALAAVLTLSAGLGLCGCGDRKTSDSSSAPRASRDTRQEAEARGLRA